MARMHSRRRGKSGSKKPLLATVPSWVQYKPEEVEALVAKLGKQGLPQSQIGLTLRDSYGVPDVEKLTGKKIGKILEEKSLLPGVPEDLSSLVKKTTQIKKHLETHKKDMRSKRGLQLTLSKIFRMAKYYKMTGKLPVNWKYE